MGDGETPSFAEAMALQKAKQLALEQAGTYVESYTKVQNFNLTSEEIQTIAGGVLQVEVLDKKRELIGDGLRHYVKIKATVTTDKMEELAQRIKGKNVAEEYQKLQADYARLNVEIENWKQLIARTPPGPEREAALNQIRERENAFTTAQKTEAALFERLVSGETLVMRAQDERATVDSLFQKILEQGYLITVGDPTLHMIGTSPASDMKLRVPVTLQTSETIRLAIEQTAQSLGGSSKVKRFVRSKYIIYGNDYRGREAQGTVIDMGRDPAVSQYFQSRVAGLTFVLNVTLKNGEGWSCTDGDQNHDAYSFFYLEMNPIASVVTTYERAGEGTDWWGYIRWVDDDGKVLVAGSYPPSFKFDDRSYSSPRLKDTGVTMRTDSVRVIAFDDIRTFSITMAIPSAMAQQIKSIGGEIKENPTFSSVRVRSETPMHMIRESVAKKNDHSWWDRLFGSTGDGQDTAEQIPEVEEKTIVVDCRIEP